MTKWKNIKDYINSHEFITRKELLLNDLLEENYINMLRIIGFIKRISPGKYITVCKIPEELTSSYLKIIAYNQTIKIQYQRKLKLNKIKEEL